MVRETTGSGAAFNAVGAWRCMFAFASDEQNVADGFNPALKVKKPARQKGRRTAIKEGHLGEMLELFASTGDDPELDSLIARFILITGARQEGVLNLRLLLMLLCGYQDPALQLGGTKGYSLAAPGPPRVCWGRGLRIAGFDPVR